MTIWDNITNLQSRRYICGYCGNDINSEKGYRTADGTQNIYICHNCQNPTHFDGANQFPGPIIGKPIQNIPKDIDDLYKETRNSYGVGAFTCSVMGSRKLIMHIAVQKGATAGLSFIEYVEYLNANHYIPPDGKGWVDQIRQKGNEANHDIKIMLRDDAEELITFIEMLLKFIYEFPSKVRKKQSP